MNKIRQQMSLDSKVTRLQKVKSEKSISHSCLWHYQKRQQNKMWTLRWKKSTLTNICAHHLYQKEGVFWNFSKGQLAWVCSVPDTQQRRPKQYLFSQERMYYIGSHNHEIMIRQGKIPVKILSDSQFQTLNFICYSLQTW